MILFIASEVMFFVAFFWMFFDMALFHESRALTPEVGTWADTAKAWSTWRRRAWRCCRLGSCRC